MIRKAATGTSLPEETVKPFHPFHVGKVSRHVSSVHSTDPVHYSFPEYAADLDGEREIIGAFTYEILPKLAWRLSTTETTEITVLFCTMTSDGSVVDITAEKDVHGYTSFSPDRQTATELFASVIETGMPSPSIPRTARVPIFSVLSPEWKG